MLKQINEHAPSQHCLGTLYMDAFIYPDPCFVTENSTSLHLSAVSGAYLLTKPSRREVRARSR
jgi:hypothetical protein